MYQREFIRQRCNHSKNSWLFLRTKADCFITWRHKTPYSSTLLASFLERLTSPLTLPRAHILMYVRNVYACNVHRCACVLIGRSFRRGQMCKDRDLNVSCALKWMFIDWHTQDLHGTCSICWHWHTHVQVRMSAEHVDMLWSRGTRAEGSHPDMGPVVTWTELAFSNQFWG